MRSLLYTSVVAGIRFNQTIRAFYKHLVGGGKLLDEKVIPHRLVGKHRRILIDDVMAYKERIDAEREDVLAQLTAEAQESDMGYSRP